MIDSERNIQKGIDEKINAKIYPFEWHSDTVNNVNEYYISLVGGDGLFGCLENGYNWTKLAKLFLNDYATDLKDDIDFDSEFSTFIATSKNQIALMKFSALFRDICVNGCKFNTMLDNIEYKSNEEIFKKGKLNE